MKKLLLALFILSILSSCSIFRKSEKRGCPTNGRNIGAERILSGDQKAIKASNKAKYKGGRKSY
ncbi:MAG: hypothetical protein IT254_12050 [Chitinophagaceae bacterium]|nr:hypothetical protein [Bacteroidota bacterium]MCC6259049.1 hypothetical protein [Chitinophagaceae bacterium]MCW5917377.1 hypothetical protein [Ferruginibacter sp.]